MSDLMLYGVLRMPYDLTMADELSRRQFYSRVQEAASRLEAAEAKLEELSRATPPSPSTAPTVEVDERAATQILKSIIEDGYLSETNVGRYHAALASKPPAREAAERQSIDTPEFRLLVDQFRSSVAFNRDERLSALIAHINTWGGAAPAAGNTAQE